MLRTLSLGLICSLLHTASAAEVFVAPSGNDTDPGTLEKPFATVQRAQDAIAPGDTVWIRGGTYTMTEKQIAYKRGIFAHVTHLTKSGAAGKRINYFAYKDEKPIFDFSAVKPVGQRVDAFYASGSWLHFKGLEVIGVQVTIKGHTQSICFENDGSNNIYERLNMHDGQAIGIYSVRGSDNLFFNCDAYNNHDYTSEDGKGGNVDGFGCHPPKEGTGNVFRGCRAWYNSDDGYDCIGAFEAVTFENCWAMYSGTNAKLAKLGDGNGFKAGGYGSRPANQLPNPIPRHVVRNCLAVGNRASGFYANHHPGGGDWLNNSAFRNGANFNMLGRLADNRTDIDGIGHMLRNNLSYKSRNELTRMDAAKCDSVNNTFDLKLKLADADFDAVNEAELLAPRQADGNLPIVKFLRPKAGSALLTQQLGVPAADFGSSTIRGKAGASEIVITTTPRVAGAIHSVTWNGKEFIDSRDHGRQLQSASNLDCGKKFIAEVFNPTEAGSASDGAGPRSSSQLLKLEAQGNELRTTNQMAFWLKPGEKSQGNLAYNDRILSNHLVAKRVRIGTKELPHAIEYDVTFTLPVGEHHTFAQFEAVTGYMPPEFRKFWKFDSKEGTFAPLDDGPGEQSSPVAFSTDDGLFAMGIYSPDQPSKGFEKAGYGRFSFKNEKVLKWNSVFRLREEKGIAAGDYKFRNFVIVGTLADVRTTMASLAKEFGKEK